MHQTSDKQKSIPKQMLFLMILNVESCSKNLNQKIKNVPKAVKEPENQI